MAATFLSEVACERGRLFARLEAAGEGVENDFVQAESSSQRRIKFACSR